MIATLETTALRKTRARKHALHSQKSELGRKRAELAGVYHAWHESVKLHREFLGALRKFVRSNP